MGTARVHQIIRAGAGNDLVCAGPGGSRVYGGAGNDRLYGQGDWSGRSGTLGDLLDGGLGNDLLDPGFDHAQVTNHGEDKVLDTFYFANAKHGVRVDLRKGRATGEGHDRLVVTPGWDVLYGSRHDDVLRGTSAGERIWAGNGTDVVNARGGDDDLDAGRGGDTIRAGAGDDFINSDDGPVIVHAGAGNDEVDVEERHATDHATVTGGTGDDVVMVFGTKFHAGDAMDGGPGNDTLKADFDAPQGLAADLATGTFTDGSRTATFHAFEDWRLVVGGTLSITGTPGPDQIESSSFGLTAHLLGGDDTITSGLSDDLVDGGPGTDDADLGGGTNTCLSVETGPC